MEPPLCAQQNYKPRRDTVRNQIMDAALVKLLTQKQSEGTPYRFGKLTKQKSHGTPNAYGRRIGEV